MPIVILARHGRSTANTEGILAGRRPGVALDDTGTSQAMGIGERLRGIDLALAVHSPLLRCHQTLDLALDSWAGSRPPVHPDERVVECDYGAWTGRALSDLGREDLWGRIQSRPSEVTFPGGESMIAMHERVVGAVRAWNAGLGERDAWLLVTHADPIKAILSDALGQPFDRFQRIGVDPGSVSVVHYPSGDSSPFVVTANSLSGQVRGFVDRFTGPAGGPEPGGGAGHTA